MDGLPAENEASQYTKRNYDKDTSVDAAEETLHEGRERHPDAACAAAARHLALVVMGTEH